MTRYPPKKTVLRDPAGAKFTGRANNPPPPRSGGGELTGCGFILVALLVAAAATALLWFVRVMAGAS